MIDQELAEQIVEAAINEGKIYYLSKWAMTADDAARSQRFMAIAPTENSEPLVRLGYADVIQVKDVRGRHISIT